MTKLIIVLCFILSLTVLNNAKKIKPKIFLGDRSRSGQFPYFAHLDIQRNDGRTLGCGGSLISDRWILTAAHCLIDVNSMNVILGISDMHEMFETGRDIIMVDSSSFYPHPFYFQPAAWNDIGLIHLPRAAKLSEYIQSIHFPTNCEVDEHLGVIAMGFGTERDNVQSLSTTLQYATLTTIPPRDCRWNFPFLLWRGSVICANSDVGQSVCPGDSGGPLIRASDNVLIGVSSFITQAGCEHRKPQGFTKIHSYFDWIYHRTKLDLPQC